MGGELGGPAELSKRELEVLRLIAQGETNAQAAKHLGISALTVKKHLEHMYAATGTRNRAELVSLAFRSSSEGAIPWLERPRPQHNLPAALTSFVGRKREVEAVASLLPNARLVTLAGPGGIGKTRLAMETAHLALGRFAGGVWMVELASLTDGRLVADEVAAALGLPPSTRSRTAAVVDHLRAKEVLLLLDNCEHLVRACAELAQAILHACPAVRILATSREPLGVDGETFWQVPPLSVPEPVRSDRLALEAAEGSESVRLFVERSRLRAPQTLLTSANAATLAQICRRLDGLPLAIELAAARMNVLSVGEIARRLDDRFRELRTDASESTPRHRTLRGAIDWSYQLLGRAEAALFERLAVFSGGCTLDAAVAVCAGSSIEPDEVLELLARLVDRCFVIADTRRAETRYRTLETLHEYARERLDRSIEASAIRASHAAWCLALAERAEHELRGPRQLEWYERLDAEHDNLRAALAWAVERDAESAQRLAGALWRFWFHRGYGGEGREWLQRALASPAETSVTARSKAMNGLGNLFDFGGDPGRSEDMHRQNLEFLRAHGGEPWLLTAALSNLGDRLRERGANAEARPLYLEALGLRGPDRWGLALTTSQLGHIALDQGDLDEAERHYREALRLWRSVRDRDRTGWALGFVARIERERGRYSRAALLLRRSLVVFRAFGDRIAMTHALAELAALAAAAGDEPLSARLLATATASRELLGAIGRRLEVADARVLAPTRERLARGELAEEWAAGLATPLDAAVDGELPLRRTAY